MNTWILMSILWSPLMGTPIAADVRSYASGDECMYAASQMYTISKRMASSSSGKSDDSKENYQCKKIEVKGVDAATEELEAKAWNHPDNIRKMCERRPQDKACEYRAEGK